MPWSNIKMSDQRKIFFEEYLKGEQCIAELCRQFGISRPTGYKWIERGESGLSFDDQSKAPHVQANATPQDIIDKILVIKFRWPKWGPKKIRSVLLREEPTIDLPSLTTIGNVLGRHGLIVPRKYRRRIAERTTPLIDCQEPNDTWCIDFKGWSVTKDGHKCGPFTMMDADSRFLLSCISLERDNTANVWGIFDRNFREYGLPLRVRSDNGPPFASVSPGRVSLLTIKLIKAGVMPEWIDPGKPQQNGRHERMHLTLESEGIFPELILAEQIEKLTSFVHYYNFIRPHEAIGQKCPAEVYKPSPRRWDGVLRSPEYPSHYKVSKVRNGGNMSWRGGDIYISTVFQGEPIGIEETVDGHILHYGPLTLGKIGENGFECKRRPSRRKIRSNLV